MKATEAILPTFTSCSFLSEILQRNLYTWVPSSVKQGITKQFTSWAPVAHTYNPSYSGGRDQEYHGSKPPQKTVQEILKKKKKPSQIKGWWSGSRCRPWVQTPVLQKKKEKSFFTFLMNFRDVKCSRYPAGRRQSWIAVLIPNLRHPPSLFYEMSSFTLACTQLLRN
jgi:hypothetical protein